MGIPVVRFSNISPSYELTRLSHADLRKEIGTLLDQWLDETASAMLARWLMEQRERPSAANANDSSSSGSQTGAHSVSDNFLTEQALPPPAPNGVF